MNSSDRRAPRTTTRKASLLSRMRALVRRAYLRAAAHHGDLEELARASDDELNAMYAESEGAARNTVQTLLQSRRMLPTEARRKESRPGPNTGAVLPSPRSSIKSSAPSNAHAHLELSEIK